MNIKQYSIVQLTENYKKSVHEASCKTQSTSWEPEFMKEQSFVFLGKIPNMPGHCVVAGQSGKVYFALHSEDFRVLSDDET